MVSLQSKNAMLMFPALSNALLQEAYSKAVKLKMNKSFIKLLEDELRQRKRLN
ncbi:sporulation histidine kinase inhibitor Sda [Pseudogracilibacillus sp. SE30717A]|uniref:sporulation histidine kinase inhibitor Sda n=1 Tax=Pseudogracilibacillus sp. SE30717A TaxID=3098293 RepID=UPI00300E44AB